jgi:hypothetical protein
MEATSITQGKKVLLRPDAAYDNNNSFSCIHF